MVLRDYQQRVVDEVRRLASIGKRKILVVMPTGAGKTHTMADLASAALGKGNKVLCLMHRRGLVEQMVERFSECDIETGCIMAGKDSALSLKCQVASLWTYVRRMQLDEKDKNDWWIDSNVVLVDEAHHILNKTYQRVMGNYKDAFVIGFTATPTLSTGAGLGNFFDSMVNVVTMDELLSGGHLVPGVYYGPSKPDLSKLRTIQGDYEKKGLDEKMNKPQIIGDVVDNWLNISGDKQTMVFAVNRKHGKALCYEFVKRGINAEYLDAFNNDEDRSGVLERFRNGDTQVICQVALYTEGTDIPEIETLILARPTKSIGFHRQILGRGARPLNGKKSFIVLDHGGNVERLGFYEDEMYWTLDDKPCSNRVQKPRTKERKILTCDMCSAEFSGRRCPVCGHQVKDYGKKIAAVDGDLVEIGKNKKPKATTEEKAAFYGMLEWMRREKGYQQGWAAHKFKAKFGSWPNHYRGTAPIEPDQAFKNYMTYQNIKFAKMREKDAKMREGMLNFG